MLIILTIFLSFALKLNAEVIQISSSPLNTTYELEKIAKSCLTSDDHDELSGYQYKTKGHARLGNFSLIKVVEQLIAYSEMRKVLRFSPFTGQYKWPTEEEMENMDSLPEKLNATNFEKYFEILTNMDVGRLINTFSLCQNELITGIQFIDKYYPAIRQIFRLKFKQFLRKTRMNRKKTQTMIDNLFKEYRAIKREVSDATEKMFENVEGKCELPSVQFHETGTLLMISFGKDKSCN